MASCCPLMIVRRLVSEASPSMTTSFRHSKRSDLFSKRSENIEKARENSKGPDIFAEQALKMCLKRPDNSAEETREKIEGTENFDEESRDIPEMKSTGQEKN